MNANKRKLTELDLVAHLEARPGKRQKDGVVFRYETAMVKLLQTLFDCAATVDSRLTISFEDSHISISGLTHIGTVYVIVSLGMDMFTDHTLDMNRNVTIDGTTLSRALQSCLKLKCDSVVLGIDDGDLSVTSQTSDTLGAQFTMRSLEADEELDVSTISYDVKFRVCTDHFVQHLKLRKKEFTLSVIGDRLVFINSSVRSKTTLSIELDPDVVTKMDLYESCRGFTAMYDAGCFTSIVKGAKLNSTLIWHP